MDATQKYSIENERVVYRIIEGEAVILNLDDGCYYSLNKVGTRIWEAIDKKKTLGEIVGLLNREYQAPEKQLKKDFLTFVEDLSSKGLLKEK